MKSLLALAISICLAQNVPNYTVSTYFDPAYNVTIRKKQVNVTFIPEGATDNTWVGHWMEGSYSTLVRSDNQNYWELSMTLHVPSFTPGFIYMLWH